MEKRERMLIIRDEILKLSGELAKYRNENNYLPVIGEGAHDARVMFIGEAPGRNEAKTGRPFCGAAGKILDVLLSSIGMMRDDVYITNIVKDRPPQNRDPEPEEIELYAPFLDRQIQIVQPRVLATLGRFSMEYVMKAFGLSSSLEPISKAHGKKYVANASYGPVAIIPLYHPAAAIYNRSLIETLRKDFKVLKDVETPN
jgi:uracil-DNA glycosylase family 4